MNALAWFDEAFSLRLTHTLLHFLWQGAVIAGVAFVGERWLRRSSAQARYLLHVTALLAMVCCLPLTFGLLGSSLDDGQSLASGQRLDLQDRASVRTAPNRTESEPPKAIEALRDALSASANVASANPRGTEVSTGGMAKAADGDANASVANTDKIVDDGTLNEAATDDELLLARFASYISIAYLTCVSALLLRLAFGVSEGRQLRSATRRSTDVDLLTTVTRQAKRIGLRATPVVAYCERVSVPVVVGILRPMILLPASLAIGLSTHQVEALISHELAHIRRYDPLVNLLQRTVEAVIFFHPATWYVSRRVRVERENATDDMVLAAGWQRVHYADALVRMAELAARLHGKDFATPTAMVAASGNSPSEFKRRVLRLLDGEPTQFRLTNLGVSLFLLIVVSAVATPLVMQAWAQPTSPQNNGENLASTPAAEQLGRQIHDFTLLDYLGAEHSLSDFADREVLVVAFLGAECPVAKLYGPRLEGLAKKYKSQNVAIIGINSNQQDTPTELGHYARQHGITFPLLKDPGNRVADLFRAERTPEAFVLDKSCRIRYWGRIDDQFGVGYTRHETAQSYIADAIDALLAGQPVATTYVEPAGCYIGRVSREEPIGDITYSNQVSRIVQRRCIECHRDGGIAPFALDSYDTVAAWAETMCEVIKDQRMPPWHANPTYGDFTNDSRMPAAEKEMLYQWVDNGVPQGSPDDLPSERTFVDGWVLGEPDLTLAIPEPITVPPDGVVDYQYVTVDPGFTEGKWVRASEIRPGVRSVVHHIIVFINPPGGDPFLEERGVGFETVGGYVPGSPPMELQPGVARYVPSGSTFVFQIHYTPDGTERRDQSRIGLYFAEPETVRRTMQTGVVVNLDLVIPPQADNFRVEAAHRFSHDMQLYTLQPHMHYRGKSFRFEATYPNGSREILLDVPRYDFNWQNTYKLAEPKFMPEGTLLRCVAYYDNSENNLSNPDPTVAVRWGEQTWDEMMVGYFEGVFLNQDLSVPPPEITSVGDGAYRAHFTYQPDRPCQTVNVAGTFNEWNSSSHPLTDPDGDGVYTTDVELAEGEHRYKFVIDGNYWTHDPASRILTGFLHESFFVAARDNRPQAGE